MSEGTPLTGIDTRTHAPVRVAATAAAPSNSHNSTSFGGWRGALRDAVVAELADFVSRHCAEALGESGVDIATDVLMGFLHSGKCLRSTFAYLGWRCGADDDEPALRAAASFELLHAFALLQDDVMDGAAVRRGCPRRMCLSRAGIESGGSRDHQSASANRPLYCWPICAWCGQHKCCGTAASTPWRCRRRGPSTTRCAPSWRSDSSPIWSTTQAASPPWDQVLAISRRKSGNYTVRGLLRSARRHGGLQSSTSLTLLGGYGEAIGEAFQTEG